MEKMFLIHALSKLEQNFKHAGSSNTIYFIMETFVAGVA